MLRRRLSEASIFELVKQKFSRDKWQSHLDTTQGPPTWEISIDIANDGRDWSDDGEYHIHQHADSTLCSLKVYNPDLNKEVRPSEEQLNNLFQYLIAL